VTAYIGSQENGAGQSTTQVIITGECLGFTPATIGNIKAVESDTRSTPNTGGTYGSTQTRTCGLSMISACQNLGSQWFPLVAAKLAPGTDPANLNFGNNTIYDTTNPSNSMSWSAACALLPSAGLTGTGPAGGPSGVAYRVAGTKICEVEVDVETADVRIIDYMGCLAVGRQIFVAGLRGQNQGGFLGMGLGEALYEETINDSTTGLKYSGTRLNANFLDFKIPTIMQVPDNLQVPVYDQVDPVGPFGAVGMGENALTAVASAVLLALSNACGGYRFTRMPVRKEDIVDALQWMKDNNKLPK
jgi:CO/xanthine dehydrogenase Mo-binding subunit